MGNDELTALAGDAGSDVLRGTQAAVDDLEQAGIVAKDAEESTTEPVAAEEPVEDVQTDAESVAGKDKHDLAAMKDAIDKLVQERQEPEADPVNAELVQMREMITAMHQEIDELKAQVETQAQVQVKEAAAWKELPDRMAAVEKEHAQAVEVVTGLYDLVMDFHTGKKEIVIERSGSGSAHDPEGKKLQEQIEQLVAPTTPAAGKYAGDTIFGGK
jgi:hypothetical protein